MAVKCLQKGWTLIPQDRGGKRRSSVIDGYALKWGAFIDSQPTLKEAQYWANMVPTANGAILLGPASGLTWALDIDVLDRDLASKIVVLADKVFGPTPFLRQGQAPKTALIYRAATIEDLPANRSYRFDGDGDHMVEIQARGRLLTAFGYHHKTGKYFSWEGPQPGSHSTEDVPLVTPAQLQEFVDHVQTIRPFSRGAAGIAQILEGDGTLEVSDEGWTIPYLRAGVVDRGTGLIVDSREAYLHALCWDLVRLNPREASASPEMAVQVAHAHAMKTVDLSKSIDLHGMIADKISRYVRSLRDGEIRSLPTIRVGADGTRSTSRQAVLATAADPELWHLPEAKKRKLLTFTGRTSPEATKAAARALQPDRTDIAIDVERRVLGAFDAFFKNVYSQDFESLPPVHVLKAPTGAGKTTRAISYIAADPRTYQPVTMPNNESAGPILFLLPTYQNIDEVRARAADLHLDPTLDDDDLKAAAKAMGLIDANDIGKAVDEARRDANIKLKTMVYRGKIAAGCQFPELVRSLQDAGISSSGLCYAKIRHRDEPDEERYCEHYSTCEAINQRKQIAESHVVFLPHAFLSLSIPEELSTARAIIADERIFPLAVHTARMRMTTLSLGREPPPLTETEREALSGDRDAIEARQLDFIQCREEAAGIVIEALKAGTDPATALAAWTSGQLTGADLVRSALRVCGGASSRNVVIHPGMSQTSFDEIVSRPTGTEIALELRFWHIVESRLEHMAAGTAKQSKDQRLQLLTDPLGNEPVEYVRLSWRSDMNWASAPTLLLDASADDGIVKKAFSGREVELHDIDAPLNLRTVLIADSTRSTTSLTPVADINDTKALVQARNVETIRAMETVLAVRHADGRIVVGMPKSVRAARGEYVPMPNVDTLHYGAERGLNFAENHVAALAVGRMELPVWTLDGLAAALAHDDADELVLLDPRGDGCDSDGNALKPQMGDLVIEMRDGSDVTIEAAMAPAGSWQRIVQVQYREESLRQLAGRLRPVFREGEAPILYLMGRVVPAGLIVDDIVTTADLLPSYLPLLDAARATAGIIDPMLAVYARPDLATEKSYADMMSAMPEQMRAAYHVVRYNVGGVVHHAAMPGWMDRPIAVLDEALGIPDIDARDLELVRSATRPFQRPAGDRPLDAIELAFGDAQDRHRSEAAALVRAHDWLHDRHAADPTTMPYAGGRARYQVGVDRDGRAIELGLAGIAMLTRPAEAGVETEMDIAV